MHPETCRYKLKKINNFIESTSVTTLIIAKTNAKISLNKTHTWLHTWLYTWLHIIAINLTILKKLTKSEDINFILYFFILIVFFVFLIFSIKTGEFFS